MRTITLAAVMLGLSVAPLGAQPLRLQSNVPPRILVDSMIQRMSEFRLRLQRIDEQLMEQMTTRTRDVAAMRQHVRLRELCTSSDDALQHMQGNVSGMQKLLADAAFDGDPLMQQYVASLSNHWNEMVWHLDGSIRVLEQMVDRLSQTTGRTEADVTR
jgi:hypothetical protein